MLRLSLALILALVPITATAQDSGNRAETLACVGAMATEADWAVCRTMMFEACAVHEVGSDPHIACLSEDRAAWQSELDATMTSTAAVLTAEGNTELTQLLTQWFGYIGQKCAAVAAERAAISAEAARLGCEISETVGLVAELAACRDGASSAPYCIRRE